jgi:hypothetical protein
MYVFFRPLDVFADDGYYDKYLDNFFPDEGYCEKYQTNVADPRKYMFLV